jgi:hypothetical protein
MMTRAERLFVEKMTPAQRDAEIIEKLIAILEATTGETPSESSTMIKKVKTQDTHKNNDGETELDPDLQFSIAAGETWKFDFWLPIEDEPLAGISLALLGPVDLTSVSWSIQVFGFDDLNQSSLLPILGSVAIAPVPTNCVAKITGTIFNGVSSGIFGLGWNQDIPTVGNTTVKAGSTLIAVKF